MNIVICEDSISDRHKLEKAITKVLVIYIYGNGVLSKLTVVKISFYT